MTDTVRPYNWGSGAVASTPIGASIPPGLSKAVVVPGKQLFRLDVAPTSVGQFVQLFDASAVQVSAASAVPVAEWPIASYAAGNVGLTKEWFRPRQFSKNPVVMISGQSKTFVSGGVSTIIDIQFG